MFVPIHTHFYSKSINAYIEEESGVLNGRTKICTVSWSIEFYTEGMQCIRSIVDKLGVLGSFHLDFGDKLLSSLLEPFPFLKRSERTALVELLDGSQDRIADGIEKRGTDIRE
jgi:hypothetical protein